MLRRNFLERHTKSKSSYGASYQAKKFLRSIISRRKVPTEHHTVQKNSHELLHRPARTAPSRDERCVAMRERCVAKIDGCAATRDRCRDGAPLSLVATHLSLVATHLSLVTTHLSLVATPRARRDTPLLSLVATSLSRRDRHTSLSSRHDTRLSRRDTPLVLDVRATDNSSIGIGDARLIILK